VIALSISLSQEVELWEASCYGLGDELDHLINIGTNVNVATGVSTGVSIHWTGLLDWTTGLDYWTHPNCNKMLFSV